MLEVAESAKEHGTYGGGLKQARFSDMLSAALKTMEKAAERLP